MDYKAAVRYLHFLADELPGDENKIITNGTSAGGALSSLMGSTGNHLTTSRICRRSAQRMLGMMCLRPPVTARSSILEHADMAYEWEFCGVNDFTAPT